VEQSVDHGGADVSMSAAFEPQEDILNVHCHRN